MKVEIKPSVLNDDSLESKISFIESLSDADIELLSDRAIATYFTLLSIRSDQIETEIEHKKSDVKSLNDRAKKLMNKIDKRTLPIGIDPTAFGYPKKVLDVVQKRTYALVTGMTMPEAVKSVPELSEYFVLKLALKPDTISLINRSLDNNVIAETLTEEYKLISKPAVIRSFIWDEESNNEITAEDIESYIDNE
jgi:hypothetical protein